MSNPKVTTESYVDHLLEDLKDLDRAAAYLSVCLEDEDPRMFALAMRDVTESWGGVGALSRSTKLNRESLYRMLSKSGNPSLTSLLLVMKALGFRLTVQPIAPPKRARRKAA